MSLVAHCHFAQYELGSYMEFIVMPGTMGCRLTLLYALLYWFDDIIPFWLHYTVDGTTLGRRDQCLGTFSMTVASSRCRTIPMHEHLEDVPNFLDKIWYLIYTFRCFLVWNQSFFRDVEPMMVCHIIYCFIALATKNYTIFCRTQHSLVFRNGYFL